MILRRSVRARLTLWYVLLVAVILAAFSAGIFLALRKSLTDNLNNSLENRASLLLGIVTFESDRPEIPGVVFSGDPAEAEQFARVFDSRGEVTFDSSPAGAVPVNRPIVERALAGEATTRHVRAGGQNLRVRTLPIQRDSQVMGALEVGLSQDDVNDTLRTLLLILAAAYPLTLGVASFGGLFLAGRALSPIDQLTGLARRISAEDLSQRLALDLPDDELGRLARTFNEMIARLDEAFRRQRRFTADASHELRTPLTAIKGHTEVALQRDRGPEAYKRALTAINEEVDRMIRLTGSLLTLARADSGQIPLHLERVDLAEVVNAAAEHVRPAAQRKGVRLEVVPGRQVHLAADEDLLLQLLLNLLDNAVKYTPPGGEVRVDWEANGAEVALRVRDTGSGIDREHLPHIFDRFYRVDKARSRAEGGAGLGLSICRWIAEAHGGAISVESAPPEKGSTFSVRFPLS
ncbi:MAG TPA: heavy metal sensor histidine kinase [Dehalococcoidia bacterium]|nr:heavy metal sensor histidine kinase [Dehalococcoidia bacterium]